MKGEQVVDVYDLIKRGETVPSKTEDVVAITLIGNPITKMYQERLKVMEFSATEEQKKATLKDGQRIGGFVLDCEVRLGKISKDMPYVEFERKFDDKGKFTGAAPSGAKPKHERLGVTRKKLQDSQKIAKHPEAVEKIKAQAKESEDIPTKTAVLSEIRYQKEKKRRKEAEGKQEKIKAIVAIEQAEYIQALDKCLRILPQKPPKDWDQTLLKEAKVKAQLIINRLEVFNE